MKGGASHLGARRSRSGPPTASENKAEEPLRRSSRLKTKLPSDGVRDSPIQPPSGQKREVDGIGDGDEHPANRARLTRRNLALLEKMNRKKGKSLDKTVSSASVPSDPKSTIVRSSAKTTSTTASGFAIQAYKNGILEPQYSKPPANVDDIRNRGLRSRETSSPTESVHETYVNDVQGAVNEATMVAETSSVLLKKYPKGYKRAFNQPFSAFPKDAGFNNGLSAPQPDFVEGLVMREFHPVPIDDHIAGSTLYFDDPDSITLPHLAGEWKGRGKDMEVARLQSAYDGAALVFARNQALSYVGKPDPPGHAHVTTFTTDGTTLNLYAHYAAPSESGTLEYHQHRINSVNLVGSHQGLKDGRRWLRNEQDYAREQSYALRDQLKDHWDQHRSALLATAQENPFATADGAVLGADAGDAEQVGFEVPGQTFQPAPAESSHASSSLSRAHSESNVARDNGHGETEGLVISRALARAAQARKKARALLEVG